MNAMVYLLQASACTGIFYCFYYFMLNRFTFFAINRWYLLATLVLSFVIPLLTITIKEEYVPVVQQSAYLNQVVNITPMPIITYVAAPVTDPVNWFSILKAVYLLAAASLLIRLIFIVIAFFASVKGKKTMRIGNVNILRGDKKLNNGSFLNYIFLNDAELSNDEIQQVIAHEMLHVKLYHSADRILFKLAQIVLWFNPFIYLYARSVEENHEFEVDREIARSTDKSKYAGLLLHLSVANHGTLYHNFSMVPLKKRITMLFNKPTKNMKKITYVLILPLVIISCLAFANLKTVKKVAELSKSIPVLIYNSDTVVTKQKIKRTPAQQAAFDKTRAKQEAYTKTEDYRQKKQMIDDISGKRVTVKIKDVVFTNEDKTKIEGFTVVYNGNDYLLRTKYGQEKQLNKLLKAGDEISFETFGAVWGKDTPVMIGVKYVYKDNQKIFQLAEADKLPTYPFLYEANKVRFADGQIAIVTKYDNGKWKTAQFQTVNGYKFNIIFKPNAPAIEGIEDGDHVRFRFVHEVKTGTKTYQTNDWVSITTDIKNYGIKNPELFNKFYQTVNVKTTTGANVSEKQPEKILTARVYTTTQPTYYALSDPLKRSYAIGTSVGRTHTSYSFTPAKTSATYTAVAYTPQAFFTRLHDVKQPDGSLRDKAVFNFGINSCSGNLGAEDSLGVFIDGEFYDEDALKKITPEKAITLTYDKLTDEMRKKIPGGINAIPFCFKTDKTIETEK
jgi:hypothetical protein